MIDFGRTSRSYVLAMAINEGSSGDGENLVPNLAANIGCAGDFDASRLDRPLDGALNENLIGGQRALDLGSLAHLEGAAGHVALHDTVDPKISRATDIANDS